MGFGLGRNTPVKLSFNRANFEALIERHGQYVRWRVARYCACVTENNRPDIHCALCGGSGEVYGFQKEFAVSFRLPFRDRIAVLPNEYADAEVKRVWDWKNRTYEFFQKENIIILNGNISGGDVLEVEVVKSLIGKTDAVLKKAGANLYRADEIETEPVEYEGGCFLRNPLDIVGIERVTDALGAEYQPIGFRQNSVVIESGEETLYGKGVAYAMPVKIAILSQELSKEDFNVVEAVQGDAVCTFPYYLNIAANDIITVLSGAETMKTVFRHSAFDTLPQFFIEDIISLESVGGKFESGVDFVLSGTNAIEWINPPEMGAALSAAFRYYPTYRVAKELPMLRTSENQRLPRKAVLKLFTGFMENRSLQWQ